MAELFDAVVQFFDEENWRYFQLGDDPVLSMLFSGENGNWNCYAECRETQGQFLFYSICPMKVPELRRVAVAEFLTRANYGLVVGNFEMDFKDGEIRYKTSIRTEGELPNRGILKHLVYSNVAMMDRYMHGLMTVMYGGSTPAEVIREIEG